MARAPSDVRSAGSLSAWLFARSQGRGTIEINGSCAGLSRPTSHGHADSLRSGAEDDSDDGVESEDGDDASGVSGSEGEEEERRGVRTPWEGRLRQNVQPPDRFVPS